MTPARCGRLVAAFAANHPTAFLRLALVPLALVCAGLAWVLMKPLAAVAAVLLLVVALCGEEPARPLSIDQFRAERHGRFADQQGRRTPR